MDLKKCRLPETLSRKLDVISASSRFIRRYLNADELIRLKELVLDDQSSDWFLWGTRQIVVQAPKGERACVFAL